LSDNSDGVAFRDSGGILITPNGPFDESVARFEISFDGSMNSTLSGSTPTFTIEYDVRVK